MQKFEEFSYYASEKFCKRYIHLLHCKCFKFSQFQTNSADRNQSNETASSTPSQEFSGRSEAKSGLYSKLMLRVDALSQTAPQVSRNNPGDTEVEQYLQYRNRPIFKEKSQMNS